MKGLFGRKSNDIECFAESCGVSAFLQIIIFAIPAFFLLIFPINILLAEGTLSVVYTTLAAVLIMALVFSAYSFKMSFFLWCAVIFALAFCLRLLCLRYWPLQPQSDNLTNLELSLRLANSPLSGWHEIFAESNHHYNVWSMHTPFIVYQTIAMKLFGHNLLAVQVVNMVFSSLACVITAALAKALWQDKRIAAAAGLLMAVNPTSLLMSAFIVNQHVATPFFLLSLYIIIALPFRRQWQNSAVCAAALAVSHLLRPEMYISVIALVCYGVYLLFGKAQERLIHRLKGVCLQIASVVFVFFLLLFMVNGIFMKMGFAGKSILAGNLKYKLAVGLNQDTEGRFLESDYPLAGNDAAVSELLAQRLSGPGQTAVLMAKKLLFQFSSYNYWWLQADKGGAVRQTVIDKVFDPLLQSYMMLILFFAFACTLKTLRRHTRKSALMYIIFIGFMAAFALVEVQQRYNYLLIPVFTVWASKPAIGLLDKSIGGSQKHE